MVASTILPPDNFTSTWSPTLGSRFTQGYYHALCGGLGLYREELTETTGKWPDLSSRTRSLGSLL
jgi:hypothetical protein